MKWYYEDHWWMPLLILVVGTIMFSAMFIVLSLAVHGTVNW